MSEYLGTRRERDEEGDGYFCRFTFGQFFTLLIMEVFTIFFVFYLGAKYGRDLLGIETGQTAAEIQTEEVDGGALPSEPQVLTTSDPAGAEAAKQLMEKAKNPELRDRIREMLAGAGAKDAARPETPEVIANNAAPPVDAAQQSGEEKAMVEADRAMQNQPPPSDVDSEAFQGANVDAGTALPAAGAKPAADERRDADAVDAQSAKDTSVIRVKSSETARYSVQVGSYPTMQEATKTVEKWQQKGYPAYMMIADIPDRGRWYRVRMGGFNTRQDADVYLKEVQTREKIEALVVLNEQ